jgi:hypothetical protein
LDGNVGHEDISGFLFVRPPWRQRHFNELVAPGKHRIDASHNRLAMLTNHGPDVGPEYDKGDLPDA